MNIGKNDGLTHDEAESSATDAYLKKLGFGGDIEHEPIAPLPIPSPMAGGNVTEHNEQLSSADAYLMKLGLGGEIAPEPEVRLPIPPPPPKGGSRYPLFSAEKLFLLQNKHLKEAAEYYEPMTKDDPQRPEGWFGVAAIHFVNKSHRRCANSVRRLMELDPSFPLVVEMIKIDPLNYESLFGVAQELLRLNQTQYSLDFFDECLRCQVIPQGLYLKADAMSRKLRSQIEHAALRAKLGKPKASLATGNLKRVVILWRVFVVLLIIGFGVYAYSFIYEGMASDYFFNKGFRKFVQGQQGFKETDNLRRRATDGVDPTEHLSEALRNFQESVEINKSHALAHYMILKTCKLIIRIEEGKRWVNMKYDPLLLKRCYATITMEERTVKTLDPQKIAARQLDKMLKDEIR